MTIRSKILAGCLALTLLTGGLGLYAQRAERELGELALRIYDEAFMGVSYLRSAQAGFAALTNAVSRDPAVDAEAQATIIDDLAIARQRAMSPAGQAAAEGLSTAVAATSAHPDPDTYAALQEAFERAVEAFARDGYRYRQDVGRLVAAQQQQMTAVMAALLAGALAITVVLTRLIAPPVRSAVRIAQAIAAGRLGKLLQADAYVKWFRSADYYSRPIKGSWEVEGGGALINQAIHQVDILLHLIGTVTSVYGTWQLGALHKIESEDVITAMLKYANGATGVIQASTAFWPGYSERVEIHGTRGTAIITGDQLTTWDVQDDFGEPAPLSSSVASGASDPMAISLEPFERQFRDFGDAIANKRAPLVSGEEGHRALAVVDAVYMSCRENRVVTLA